MVRLWCVSFSLTTDERPTSEPVPAVVGRAMKYGSSLTMGRTLGWSQTYSITSPSCVAIRPTTLATSSAAPPPKPMTLSAPCALKAAAPAITCAQVGLPKTPSNTATCSPGRRVLNSAITGSAANALSVTMSGRLQPCSCRCAATPARAPAPKWMGVGKAKRVMVMVRGAGCQRKSDMLRRRAALVSKVSVVAQPWCWLNDAINASAKPMLSR